jgi:hypothetical protein
MTLYGLLLRSLTELEEMHATGPGSGGLRHGRGASGHLRGYERSKEPAGMSGKDYHIGDKWMSMEEAILYLKAKLKEVVPEKELEHMDIEEMMHKAKELSLKL